MVTGPSPHPLGGGWGGVTPGSCLEELCVFRKTRGGCGLCQGNFVIFPSVTLEASECHTHLVCGENRGPREPLASHSASPALTLPCEHLEVS